MLPEPAARTVAAKRGTAAAARPAPEARQASKRVVSDVDQPAYSFQENAANYAVVVGVEGYQNLPSADFAKRDAEDFAVLVERAADAALDLVRLPLARAQDRHNH